MTLVGKIFSVAMLVLSIFFVAAAVSVYATHRNWRRLVDNPSPSAGEKLGLRQQLAGLEDRNKQLRDELEKGKTALAFEQAARRFALAAQRTKLEEAEQSLQQREKQLSDLQAAHGELEQANRVTVTQLQNLTDEVKSLRDEIAQAREDRNEKVAEVVQLTDELNRLRGEERTLVARRDQLVQMLSEYKFALDRHDIKVTDDPHAIPVPVDGVVVRVSKDLVEISIGGDDGLKKGHKLEVFRDNVYLGQVVIRMTEPNRAVAEIVKEMQQGIIKIGDRVSTKLG